MPNAGLLKLLFWFAAGVAGSGGGVFCIEAFLEILEFFAEFFIVLFDVIENLAEFYDFFGHEWFLLSQFCQCTCRRSLDAVAGVVTLQGGDQGDSFWTFGYLGQIEVTRTINRGVILSLTSILFVFSCNQLSLYQGCQALVRLELE